jgi:hypothetical protein
VAADTPFIELARSEIDELHAFFQAWYRGVDTDGIARVAGVLATEFELLASTGECLSRAQLLSELAGERGAYPNLEIGIVYLGSRFTGQNAASIEYIEQHVENGQIDKRLCCALLRRSQSESRPVEWVAIYERTGA